MSEENSPWILYNDGEKYTISIRSVLAPDTYVQVATFSNNVPYIIIDTIRFVLNRYYADADNETSELFKEREMQWAPYTENLQHLTQKLQGEDKATTPATSGGQYL